MKNWLVSLSVCLSLVVGFPVWAEELSPAQQKIEMARRSIEKNPNYAPAYNELALALSQRARETSDVSYYNQALETLEKSFKIAPDNFEGRKTEVWLLLGKHEFAKARVKAHMLNRQVPDDLTTYALLTDACVELGQYKEAEEAAQWMLNLRPGDVRGLTRGAYLRELFGNLQGALEFFQEAYTVTPANETENRAWILTQMGHLALLQGRTEISEQFLTKALTLFPDYHYALAGMAKVRAAQARYPEAVELLQKRYAAASHAENLYDLAEMMDKAGQTKEAEALYREFEQKALKESPSWDNSNKELIFYYADKAAKPKEALKIAKLERSRRQDVYTRDAYAWALSANGQNRQALSEIRRALEVGVQDPSILHHAQVIAERLKQPGPSS